MIEQQHQQQQQQPAKLPLGFSLVHKVSLVKFLKACVDLQYGKRDGDDSEYDEDERKELSHRCCRNGVTITHCGDGSSCPPHCVRDALETDGVLLLLGEVNDGATEYHEQDEATWNSQFVRNYMEKILQNIASTIMSTQDFFKT